MTKPLALLTLFASFGAAPAAYAAETPPQKEDLMRKANPGFTEDIYVTTGGEGEIPKRYEEWTAPRFPWWNVANPVCASICVM